MATSTRNTLRLGNGKRAQQLSDISQANDEHSTKRRSAFVRGQTARDRRSLVLHGSTVRDDEASSDVVWRGANRGKLAERRDARVVEMGDSATRDSGEADESNRYTVLIRRRCRSVLERALSSEYHQVKVRKSMRYDDLVFRLRVATTALDDRDRREVGALFRDVNRKYFASLYNVTKMSFVIFDEAATVMRDGVS